MRYWLLVVICLMLIVSAAAEPATLDLEPITPNNVIQIELLRQFGEVSNAFKPAFTPLSLENNQLLFQPSADQPVQILPMPPKNFSKLIASALSPNARYLVAILADQTAESQNHVVMWDMGADSPKISFTALVGKAYTIAWRPDSRLVAIDSIIYDATTGDIVFRHVRRWQSGDTGIDWCGGQTESSEGYAAISWSPDSTRYAALSYGICASSLAGYGVFDAETGALLFELENSKVDTHWVRLTWSPDSAQVTNGYIMWLAATGLIQSQLKYELTALPSVTWLDNQYLIGSQSSDPYVTPDTIRVYKWEASSGLVLFAHEFQQVTALRIQKNAIAVTSGFAHLTVDIETGIVRQEDALAQSLGGTLAWSPDSSRLVVVSGLSPAPLVQVWDAAALLSEAQPHPQWRMNADWLAYQTQLSVYQPVETFPVWLSNEEFFTYSSRLYYMGLRPWTRVQRWNMAENQTTDVYWSEAQSPDSLKILVPNRDLTRIAEFTAGFMDEATIRVLDTASLAELGRLSSTRLPDPPGVVWSPAGDQLAIFDNEGLVNAVSVWSLDQLDTPRVITPLDFVLQVAWHPEGQYLALVQIQYTESTRRGKVDIYDINAARVISTFTLEVNGSIDETAWSPDGGVLMLATSTSRGLIFLDEFGERVIAKFPDIRASVETSLQWSPDGRLIAFSPNNNHLMLLGISRD